MSENSVNGRLMQFLKNQGISARKFELSIGASNGYAKTITKGISAERLRQIGRAYPMLNTDWLLTGEGSMLKTSPFIEQNNVNGSNMVTSGTTTIETNTPELAELQAKLREKDMEIAHLHDQLMKAEEWNSRLFELLKKGQK